MKQTTRFWLLVLALLMISIAGCRSSATDAPDMGSEGEVVALMITGSVKDEIAWSEEQIHNMDTVQVESTNKDGESDTRPVYRLRHCYR